MWNEKNIMKISCHHQKNMKKRDREIMNITPKMMALSSSPCGFCGGFAEASMDCDGTRLS